MFDAPAGLCTDCSKVNRLHGKQPILLRLDGRQELLGADDVDLAQDILASDRTLPPIVFALNKFKPRLTAGVVEGRVDRAVFGNLIVPIVGIAPAKPDSFQKSAGGVVFGPRVKSCLLDIEAD